MGETCNCTEYIRHIAGKQKGAVRESLQQVAEALDSGDPYKAKIRPYGKRTGLWSAIVDAIPSLTYAKTKSIQSHIGKVVKELQEVGATPEHVRLLPKVLRRYSWFDELTLGMIPMYIHEAEYQLERDAKTKGKISKIIQEGKCPPEWVEDIKLKKRCMESGWIGLSEEERGRVLDEYNTNRGK